MKKRIVSLFLILSLVFSVNTICSFADDNHIEQETYTLSEKDCSSYKDGEVIIVLSKSIQSKEIVVDEVMDSVLSLSRIVSTINIMDIDDMSSIFLNANFRYNDINDSSDIFGYDYWNGSNAIIFSPQNGWSSNPFADVSNESGYLKAVEYVYSHNYMTGTSNTSFSPLASLSRAQTAVILYAMAGHPGVSGYTIPFTDVDSNAYYYDAVRWVYNNGIMSGTSATLFSPDVDMNIQMLAVILKNYANLNNYALNPIRSYSAFNDDNQIASWAKGSIKLLYEAGIINPDNNNNINPTTALTRSQVAIIVRKFEVVNLYL